MLAFEDCGLMLDESINQPRLPRAPVWSTSTPDDIFAYHLDVRRRGLDVPSITHPFCGSSEFRIEDPDGNRLWIGQRTDAVP